MKHFFFAFCLLLTSLAGRTQDTAGIYLPVTSSKSMRQLILSRRFRTLLERTAKYLFSEVFSLMEILRLGNCFSFLSVRRFLQY